ncbi:MULTISPECIES: hypothetical protein [Streptomyces violaceusniger group]|uniref:Uncharacterized protein n=2 Tax=Streptomyces rhizosphaericus TaxID=114699 RepID=A0ABN1RZJ7_9ACTN|nr:MULTISPECIES: hypothetical protein [Streptomyces violaceusniger group]
MTSGSLTSSRKLTAPQISLRFLRRSAAARLVQLSADCSLWEAAQWLGIRPRAIQVTTADDTLAGSAVIRSTPRFTAAVDHLVHHLGAANERIDYQHRRETLRDWWIPASTWEELTAQMPRRGAPDLGRLKCQTASVFVWTTITQGDVLLAPRPLDADVSRPRPVGWSNQRNQFWDHLAHSKHLKHYVDLRQALTDYAAHLAQEIDSRSTA